MKATYDDETGHLTFSNGESILVHCGLISVGAGGEIYQGYDGHVRELSDKNALEVADYAIDLWLKYKAQVELRMNATEEMAGDE